MGINDYNLSNMRCNVEGALICHGKCALVIAYVTRSRGFPCVVNAWKQLKPRQNCLSIACLVEIVFNCVLKIQFLFFCAGISNCSVSRPGQYLSLLGEYCQGKGTTLKRQRGVKNERKKGGKIGEGGGRDTDLSDWCINEITHCRHPSTRVGKEHTKRAHFLYRAPFLYLVNYLQSDTEDDTSLRDVEGGGGGGVTLWGSRLQICLVSYSFQYYQRMQSSA